MILADQMRANLPQVEDGASIVDQQIALIKAGQIRLDAENVLENIGDLDTGIGGEVFVLNDPTTSGIVKRTAKRTRVTLVAAVERLNLIHNNDVFDLALDAAELVGAKTAIEKMLVHQMAAAHKTALDLLEKNKLKSDPIDEVRRVNAASQLMAVFQQGALTLHRLRNGGNQVVTVKHVTVASGGQALNGNVGGGSRQPGSGDEKIG